MAAPQPLQEEFLDPLRSAIRDSSTANIHILSSNVPAYMRNMTAAVEQDASHWSAFAACERAIQEFCRQFQQLQSPLGHDAAALVQLRSEALRAVDVLDNAMSTARPSEDRRISGLGW